MNTNNWASTIVLSFQNMWDKFTDFLPELLVAIIVLIVGLLIAAALGRVAAKLIRLVKLDDLLSRTGVSQKAESAGVQFSLSGLVGWIVKWFFIIVVFIAVADILSWVQVTDFLTAVALYIPNVLIAVIILTVGIIVGQFIHDVVEKAIHVSKAPTTSAKTMAALSKWSIVIFSIMAALIQLGVAVRLIEILFTGLVAMLAIAGGLAFGLGGKEKASKWLEAIEKEVSRR
ncbi:MAG: hypothetical protein ABIJ81_00515 [Patescibacteria group bacterium]